MQAVLLLSPIYSFNEMLNIIGVSFLTALIGLVPGKHENIYNPDLHIIYFFIIFMFVFNLKTNKKVLPAINEQSLIFFNIMFLYYYVLAFFPYLSNWNDSNIFFKIMTMIILLPSMVVIYSGFTNYEKPIWLKLSFYLWYLAMAAGILSFVIIPIIYEVYRDQYILNLSWLTAFTLGMITLWFCIDLFNILLLMPLTNKNQTWEQRKANIKAHIQMLQSKFLDEEVSALNNFTMIIFVTVVLIANALYFHFNDLLVVNLAVLAQRYVYGSIIVEFGKITQKPSDK